MSDGDLRFIDLKEVIHRTSLSRATIYRKLDEDAFPKPITLAGTRRIVWVQSEVADWLQKQLAHGRKMEGERNDN